MLVQGTDSQNAAGDADSAIDDAAVLTITVTNANEASAVTISGTVEADETLTAALVNTDAAT